MSTPAQDIMKDGLFDCFKDTDICCYSCCCHCCQMGKNAEKVGESYCLYCCIVPMCAPCLHTCLRSKVQQHVGVKDEGTIINFLYTYLCGFCSLVQESRALNVQESPADPKPEYIIESGSNRDSQRSNSPRDRNHRDSHRSNSPRDRNNRDSQRSNSPRDRDRSKSPRDRTRKHRSSGRHHRSRD